MVMRLSKLPISFIAVLAVCAISHAQTALGKDCGVDTASAARRVFLSSNDELNPLTWTEVRKLLDNAADYSETAEVWRNSEGKMLVDIEIPVEDFSISNEYCFDRHGKLTRVLSVTETAWGWGHAYQASLAANGKLADVRTHFFDTGTQARIRRPRNADDAQSALRPDIYLHVRDLPFGSELIK